MKNSDQDWGSVIFSKDKQIGEHLTSYISKENYSPIYEENILLPIRLDQIKNGILPTEKILKKLENYRSQNEELSLTALQNQPKVLSNYKNDEIKRAISMLNMTSKCSKKRMASLPFFTSDRKNIVTVQSILSRHSGKKLYIHFFAGLIAGAISRTITAPLDRLKIIYQVNYHGKDITPPSFSKGLFQLYQSDGWRGLFRGNMMTLLKSAPETAIKFYVFEKGKQVFSSKVFGQKLALFLSGATAGAVSSAAVFPFDALKTRLSAATSETYNGIIDIGKKVYQEGGVRAFYSGVRANVISAVLNSGFNLYIYEHLKSFLSKRLMKKNFNELSSSCIMLCGGLSAVISSSLFYPFQIIQSRLIMQMHPKVDWILSSDGEIVISRKQQSLFAIAKDIVQSEGMKGLYKGYCPAMSKIIFGNAIGFALYEFIKNNIENKK